MLRLLRDYNGRPAGTILKSLHDVDRKVLLRRGWAEEIDSPEPVKEKAANVRPTNPPDGGTPKTEPEPPVQAASGLGQENSGNGS